MMIENFLYKVVPIALLILLIPTICLAHPGHDLVFSFSAGFFHPLLGLDHLCAIFAVGLWAAQRGRRAVFLIPIAFVSSMIVGSLLGAKGVSLPFIENGVVLSILVFGLLGAFTVSFPVAISGFLVCLFALFHGHAHGTEMPATVAGLEYGAGFVLATSLLHVLGIAFAVYSKRLSELNFVRYAGGAIACFGFYLTFI